MDHPRYKIQERIDAGGMAEVFRGVAESTVGGIKRHVAIKRILPSLTKNKKFVSMFLDEARLSMYLQHANIVHVSDIGVADLGGGAGATYFLVMEYVDGVNLKTLLEFLRKQGTRLPVSHTLYIMIEVCKALSYAHDLNDPESNKPLGIVHRDISPPNILLSRRGEVKLADFGLAKATSQIEGTDPGIVKGKFSYLSPESASGVEVDKRADIFAVGILLYEMLTGTRLFDAETDYDTINLVRVAQVPPLAPQNPSVEPELEGVVRKALAKDPALRYQRADDLGDAMAHYLFSRNLKVTNRDIEVQVSRCIVEKQKSQSNRQSSLIDTLIQDEILKFTSLEDMELAGGSSEGGQVGEGMRPLNPEQFVNISTWASEIDGGPEGKLALPTDESGSESGDGTSVSLEKALEGRSQSRRIVTLTEPPRNPTKLVVLGGLLILIVALLIYLLS